MVLGVPLVAHGVRENSQSAKLRPLACSGYFPEGGGGILQHPKTPPPVSAPEVHEYYRCVHKLYWNMPANTCIGMFLCVYILCC